MVKKTFFQRLFGVKKEFKEVDVIKSKEIKMNEPIASDPNVVYASSIPISVSIGNLIFEKKYKEAIEIGETLLLKSNDCSNNKMIHIDLMQAYFKIRMEDPKYFDLSTYHAKQAIVCGHNTGLAQDRLVINLEKTKRINQAIQLCEIILSPRFTFSKHSYRTNEGFKLRYSKLIKKLAIADDTPDDILFTDNEKELIYKRSKYNWY